MKRIGILALDHCLQSSVTGFYDILSVASMATPLFELSIVSDRGEPVTCFNGLTIRPHKAAAGDLDILMIPVIYGDIDPVLANKRLIDWIRDLHTADACICAVCAGVFVLARTGLLAGRTATTHWHLAKDFINRFPDVRLKPEKMLVDEGDVITAGGVTAYMDLALYLTARFGSRELASTLSKSLLIDPQRVSQTPYTTKAFNTSHGDDTILKLQTWMEAHHSSRLTLPDLADQAGLGLRTLARRFKKATGDTPLEYLQHLRLGAARTLLETTTAPIDQITWDVGYEDVSSFRRLFKRETGLSPAAYRKKFSIHLH